MRERTAWRQGRRAAWRTVGFCHHIWRRAPVPRHPIRCWGRGRRGERRRSRCRPRMRRRGRRRRRRQQRQRSGGHARHDSAQRRHEQSDLAKHGGDVTLAGLRQRTARLQVDPAICHRVVKGAPSAGHNRIKVRHHRRVKPDALPLEPRALNAVDSRKNRQDTALLLAVRPLMQRLKQHVPCPTKDEAGDCRRDFVTV